MATELQILANRRNAQKSTGPRTSEGKTAISQNAVKHGLLARNNVIDSESQADFDLYRNQILAELDPVSPMESMLAERVVALSWRLKRICRIQNQAIDTLNEDNTSSPLAKLTQSLLLQNQSQPATSNSARHLTLGRLAVKDFANARVLDRLLMYERRIENSLYKTILEIQRLNLVRKLNTGSEKPANLFMQNKPNLPNTQMNVSPVNTTNYEPRTTNCFMKNKPNSNPIKAKTNPIQSQSKPKQSQFIPTEGGSNPIRSLPLPDYGGRCLPLPDCGGRSSPHARSSMP